MDNHKELIERLKIDAEWAEGQEWEAPLCLWDDLMDAVSAISDAHEITPEAEYAINKHADSLIKRMDALLHQDDSELEAYRALGSIDHLRKLVQAEKDGRLFNTDWRSKHENC